YWEQTPNGVHLVYRCPDGVEGNQKLAQRECGGCEEHPDGTLSNGRPAVHALIETRGEGGYIVSAPSNGSVHASGKPYVLMSAPLSDIATIDASERDILLGIARSMDEMPRRIVEEPVPIRPDAIGTR